MHIFGPVPSRRLGKSLGVSIIPPKYCSYSCIYCQLGVTQNMQIEPIEIKKLKLIKDKVKHKIKVLRTRGEKIDYLTFVADGEPTLAFELGELIDTFKDYGVKIAVITNASLLWKDKVKNDLQKADWISLKCDSVVGSTWKKINRPYGQLDLNRIQEGMIEFAGEYQGILATETMLLKDMNDKKNEIEQISQFVKKLAPEISYLSIPTRPPAEGYAVSPSPEFINLAFNIFKRANIKVEYLIGYEGNEFASTGDIVEDVLSISAVHPLKEEAVDELINKCEGSWSDIDRLVFDKKLFEVEYENSKYYIRQF
ncbi:MAG: radical SAM protein [Halothermotrichaceae bacterium]